MSKQSRGKSRLRRMLGGTGNIRSKATDGCGRRKTHLGEWSGGCPDVRAAFTGDLQDIPQTKGGSCNEASSVSAKPAERAKTVASEAAKVYRRPPYEKVVFRVCLRETSESW